MLILNAIMLPTGIKNTIMPLTTLKFHQYAIADLPFYAFFTTLLVNIGLSLDTVNEIFQRKKKWGEVSTAQKVGIVSSWVIIASTLIFACVMGFSLRKRYLEIDEEAGSRERLEDIEMDEM